MRHGISKNGDVVLVLHRLADAHGHRELLQCKSSLPAWHTLACNTRKYITQHATTT